ncbi:MAG: protein-export chaperone SecB [Chryseolinea sp.]
MQDSDIKKASINLLSFQVTSCVLDCSTVFVQPPANAKLTFTLNHNACKIVEDPNVFIIQFWLKLGVEERGFDLNLTFKTLFKSDNIVDDNFLNSQFVRLNAPAIAFPFLRSFVSTLTVNAGYGGVILPAINFAESKFLEEAPKADTASPQTARAENIPPTQK